jgi:hypothetical protein
MPKYSLRPVSPIPKDPNRISYNYSNMTPQGAKSNNEQNKYGGYKKWSPASPTNRQNSKNQHKRYASTHSNNLILIY